MVTEDVERRLLKQLEDICALKGLSGQTVRAYSSVLAQYFAYLRHKETKLGHESVKDYLLTRKVNPNSLRLHRAALQFLFTHILDSPFSFNQIPIKKRPKQLPKALSRQAVKTMIDSTENPKHKLIVQLLYSCGLRLSELVNLRRDDIDFDRGLVHVRKGKGSKDRYTTISQSLQSALLRYYATNTFATPYILEGRNGKYSKKSVQKVVEQAGKRAAVKATPHTLRHSFATHLLEAGVSLRHIQQLLGHASLDTTQVYTHIANSDIAAIPNPLDRLERNA